MNHFTRLPPITLSIADRDRLEQLANASIAHFPQTADYLAREVERARLLELEDDGRGFVSMGSWVAFRDDRGQTRHVSLVYPHEADVSAGKISVLTPIGAALIGLSENQSIEWQTPAGEWRSLTVLAVGDAVRLTQTKQRSSEKQLRNGESRSL